MKAFRFTSVISRGSVDRSSFCCGSPYFCCTCMSDSNRFRMLCIKGRQKSSIVVYTCARVSRWCVWRAQGGHPKPPKSLNPYQSALGGCGAVVGHVQHVARALRGVYLLEGLHEGGHRHELVGLGDVGPVLLQKELPPQSLQRICSGAFLGQNMLNEQACCLYSRRP